MSLLDSPLLAAMRSPNTVTTFNTEDLDKLVRQARAAGLLARIGESMAISGAQEQLPVQVLRHFEAVQHLAIKQQQQLRWEVKQLDRALADLGIRVVLLKGAAYVMGHEDAARGRLFSDIDLLVPKADIDSVEAALMLAGWITSHHDDYDDRYYREWMHELPPMRHIRRQTVLDVHHNILPETARLKTKPDLILQAARLVPGYACIHIPSPEDLILHSATHLFHEGEWEHGLRDLSDLDILLRQYGTDEAFWERLADRAAKLNLLSPLGYALRHTSDLLGTPIPDKVKYALGNKPVAPIAAMMGFLFLRGFSTAHHSCRLSFSRMAQAALYMRAHWLRMPLHLLLPHLAYKALWRESEN